MGLDGQFAGRSVTTFVTRLGRKVKERIGTDRTNGILQAVDIATNCGETIAIASVVKAVFCPSKSTESPASIVVSTADLIRRP
jgi:hypothetical protein